MSYQRPSKLLILITLLVLCGQTMAAPFLACRNPFAFTNSTQAAMEAMGSHCSGMMMPMVGPDHEIETTPGVDEVQRSSLLAINCELLCQFCRGVSSFDLHVMPVLAVPESVPVVTANPLVQTPAPLLDDHFRPPASTLI